VVAVSFRLVARVQVDDLRPMLNLNKRLAPHSEVDAGHSTLAAAPSSPALATFHVGPYSQGSRNLTIYIRYVVT
jgi:hypothetical protein